MPLSRFTQTFPPDFAEAMSESEAAPVGAALAEVFLAGAELVVGVEFAAAVLAGALAGAIVDLLGGGVDGAELAFDAGAMVESLEDLLFRLFLLVVITSELAVLAERLLPALAPPAAGWSPPAAVVSDFFLWLFFAVVLLSELALADWSALASLDFLLWLFLVVPLSAPALVLAD